jgi:hypothetical protein
MVETPFVSPSRCLHTLISFSLCVCAGERATLSKPSTRVQHFETHQVANYHLICLELLSFCALTGRKQKRFERPAIKKKHQPFDAQQ